MNRIALMALLLAVLSVPQILARAKFSPDPYSETARGGQNQWPHHLWSTSGS